MPRICAAPSASWGLARRPPARIITTPSNSLLSIPSSTWDRTPHAPMFSRPCRVTFSARACWKAVFIAKFTGLLIAAIVLLSAPARADDLPDGKGKELILRACIGCHKAEEIAVYRFTKDEYQTIVYRMGDRGAQATRAELDVIADYLFANFPKIEDATKINVNKATAQEIAA